MFEADIKCDGFKPGNGIPTRPFCYLDTQLQDRCTRLESLCKARRAEAWERSQAYLHFQEKFTSVSIT
jgi:hypothetical protein